MSCSVNFSGVGVGIGSDGRIGRAGCNRGQILRIMKAAKLSPDSRQETDLTKNRNVGYTGIMYEEISIGRRGAITLPAKLRRKFGLNQNDKLIVEDTEQGLLLRPAVSMPIEIYTEQRIEEFQEDEVPLGKMLERLDVK